MFRLFKVLVVQLDVTSPNVVTKIRIATLFNIIIVSTIQLHSPNSFFTRSLRDNTVDDGIVARYR